MNAKNPLKKMKFDKNSGLLVQRDLRDLRNQRKSAGKAALWLSEKMAQNFNANIAEFVLSLTEL
jgi:hypothetical protein